MRGTGCEGGRVDGSNGYVLQGQGHALHLIREFPEKTFHLTVLGVAGCGGEPAEGVGDSVEACLGGVVAIDDRAPIDGGKKSLEPSVGGVTSDPHQIGSIRNRLVVHQYQGGLLRLIYPMTHLVNRQN